MPYEIISLNSFQKSLEAFNEKDSVRLLSKAHTMLSTNPYRYEMLKGMIEIKGVYITGLRKFKSGLSGQKGGAYVLYRICEECKKNGYNMNSDVSCEFCDGKKDKHIVLFISRPRSFGYD